MQSVQEYLRSHQQVREQSSQSLISSYSPYPKPSPNKQPSHSPGYFRKQNPQIESYPQNKACTMEDITNITTRVHSKTNHIINKPHVPIKPGVKWEKESDFVQMVEMEYRNSKNIRRKSNQIAHDSVDNYQELQKQSQKQQQTIVSLQNDINVMKNFAVQAKVPSYISALFLKAI